MERAGEAVYREVHRLLPDGGRVAFLCAKGNNGGDGFVAARWAHENGLNVECLVAAEESDLKGEPREQMRKARAAGVNVIFANETRYARRTECLGCRDLIVDALLGTGARSEVKGAIRDAIQAINRSGVPVLAVDVPSGIDCDTGEELGDSVWALKTLTFGLPKPYLFLGTGLEHAGYWEVVDIGFPDTLLDEPTGIRLIENDWVDHMLPERLKASHKGDNGHVVIIAGSQDMPGAATMAARAAMRAGAGLVTVAAIPYVCQVVASQHPECTFLTLPERNGAIAPEATEALRESEGRFQSAVFGPGLSTGDGVLQFLTDIWGTWKLPTVFDADALNAVSMGIALPDCDGVLTPHPGEMSRLLEESTAEIQADRFGTVRRAVEKYQRSVLLKGPYSIVGGPNQPLTVNDSGNSGMATGGMGDVLSGVIATLLGQSLPAYFAACAGMYWHGLAGDLCSEEIGPVGYSATDVASRLPQARAKIQASCEQDTGCSS